MSEIRKKIESPSGKNGARPHCKTHGLPRPSLFEGGIVRVRKSDTSIATSLEVEVHHVWNSKKVSF